MTLGGVYLCKTLSLAPICLFFTLFDAKTPFLPLVPPWQKNSAQQYFKPSQIDNKNLNNQPKSSPFSVRLIAFHTNTQLCLSQHRALTIFSFFRYIHDVASLDVGNTYAPVAVLCAIQKCLTGFPEKDLIRGCSYIMSSLEGIFLLP